MFFIDVNTSQNGTNEISTSPEPTIIEHSRDNPRGRNRTFVKSEPYTYKRAPLDTNRSAHVFGHSSGMEKSHPVSIDDLEEPSYEPPDAAPPYVNVAAPPSYAEALSMPMAVVGRILPLPGLSRITGSPRPQPQHPSGTIQ